MLRELHAKITVICTRRDFLKRSYYLYGGATGQECEVGEIGYEVEVYVPIRRLWQFEKAIYDVQGFISYTRDSTKVYRYLGPPFSETSTHKGSVPYYNGAWEAIQSEAP